MLDWEYMTDVLARGEPSLPPGPRSAYHALTYGWLVGELVQRVSGQPLGALLDELLARPLGLDGLYVGVPEDASRGSRASSRLARRRAPVRVRAASAAGSRASFAASRSRSTHATSSMRSLPHGIREFDFSADATVRVPIPAANGHFTARSLARLYAALGAGGELDGTRILSAETLRRATRIEARSFDRVVPFPMHWRLGFHRAATTRGTLPQGFGHFGFGGSGAFCDPASGLAVALVLNSGVGHAFRGPPDPADRWRRGLRRATARGARADRMTVRANGRISRWRDRDHTRGNLLGSLLVLALPLLATNLAGAIMYQIVDLAFLSRLGDAAMAAVIIVNQTIWQVVLMIMMGATFGTQALVASAVGAGDAARAERTAAQSLLVGAGFAIVVALAGALFAEELFSATGADASFASFGVPYVRVQLLLAFGLIGAMLFRAILTGAGDTTTGLLVTLAQTPIALAIEWALMFGRLGLPALGVRGAAIGVAVGQIFALAVGMWVLFRGRSRVRLEIGALRPDRRLLAKILRLSWAPALQMLGMVLTTFVYLRLTRQFGGAVQAAYSIGLRVGMIVPLISFPLASASATQVGQALGAGDVRRAWRAVGTGILVHGAVLWTAAAALVLFRVEILTAVSGDPEVVRVGSQYLLFLGGSFAIMGVQLVVMRCLQGAGDFYVPMLISLGGTLLISLPLAVLSVRATTLGPNGLWAANLVAGAATAIASLAWLGSGRWTARAAAMRVDAPSSSR